MLIKLDMSNYFDQVNLSYIFKVLLSFGFNSAFFNMIKACTNKPWIVPLINGRPASYFQVTRGIRQGCPLSPFLYILLADSLSRKLTAERNKGVILGIRSMKGIEPINHALFVDDSLLLGGASLRIVGALLPPFTHLGGTWQKSSSHSVCPWGQHLLAPFSGINLFILEYDLA